MGNLLLNSLEIQNFRGFRHLKIERLGRVNLIVGKNNVGKSSLLEALRLYAHRGLPTLIRSLLLERDEIKLSRSDINAMNAEIEEMLSSLKYMFYGRKDVRGAVQPIYIGPIDSPNDVLSIVVNWYVELFDEDNGIKRRRLQSAEYGIADDLIPYFDIQLGMQPKVNYRVSVRTNRLLGLEIDEIKSSFISSSGFNNSEVGALWDQVALTEYEKQVVAALHIIALGVEGVSIIGESRERIPIVKIAAIEERLPLRGLGEGMQRILGITLALVNAKDGILLIDEVENGLHYSVQPELWQLIFQIASRLNVQVFATTHSWDCIEGFQKAAQENTQEEGLLVRLSVKEDEIVATVFDERKLGIATREQIEVR
ncbi:MAG: AAA family ATPase [Ktedonobacteraceae bacterium]